MYGFTGETIDIEDIRRRFRAMSDRDLLLTGEGGMHCASCRPEADHSALSETS